MLIPSIIIAIKYEILIRYSKLLKIIIIDIVVVCLFLLFSLIPFELIENNIVKKAIKQISSYTGGIYYIHYIVKKIFGKYFNIFNAGNLKSCAINYFVSYFICFIGSTLFQKNKIKYLFL